ncbi:hypothetical protein COT44_01260 [Candidatus Shapirobacteria bacterium CG08_land_8_20_14_0_20_39_18]|uniref:TrpR like protein, YerC/YecD n=1 Tax=Candidatus Shapirobacteria bacterium CG08_land_8_20_14_0_20_39_18 TaxID=1974883 RepID=A0A2M6XDN8_9BACT|nr:MAG: hypothetical protein COT44_01260 [Candidatus Shapirobacteria bacterium CG08_land_8_20_14_0_20_39_18]PIY66274.1 MAG: hypothetical protein COY91_00875 [Candidatus Shapirobacteria bacterium CG_4_10_14_0_8_um_filter_39_15]PJE68684.1 MAG: hypothetical protein COU94_00770 [Candidatus Shapirobacteria bacterium CG10_big_fil_rev_8_21_14_0_10_38_8]
MTQVSKYPISDKVYQRIVEIFFKSLAQMGTGTEAKEFIRDFLSPTERVMLAKRLTVAFLLEKNYDFRTISHVLRVSLSTVARVNLARKYGTSGYKRVIEKILREEKVKDFFLEMTEGLSDVAGQGRMGSGGWRYLSQEIKKKRKEKPF